MEENEEKSKILSFHNILHPKKHFSGKDVWINFFFRAWNFKNNYLFNLKTLVERTIQHVIKLLSKHFAGFWVISLSEFCRNNKSSSLFPCHSCKKEMNFISQDFSIYMSRAHDPLASLVLKRGIIAAYAQAGTGLQTRLTKSGGRIITCWVLGITADSIYSSHRERIYLQWLWKTDSDLASECQ